MAPGAETLYPWYDAAGVAETGNTTLTSPISPDGTPELGRDYTLPGRQGRAVRVAKGQSLTIVNTHGTQVVDFWAFNAGDLSEFLSNEHWRAFITKVMPDEGDPLISNRRRALMTMTEDTSPGIHDTLMAACDRYRYQLLGVESYHDSCTDNLRMAMAAIGIDGIEVPSPFNVWMNIPVAEDGGLSFQPTVSGPGDRIVLRAEMDLICAMSACPQDKLPINGVDCIVRDCSFRLD